MPVLNRAAAMQAELAEWRRELHRKPELLFDVHETAAFVESRLGEFGVDEVVTGLGRTGVVGVIRGRRDGARVIGLRADMDALPILEESGKPWRSQVNGKMHACGHDGHTAMLLGAARHLAETRNFSGSVAVIFQPAEEGGGGGREMVEDGLMERFGIQEVYGMHNMPGLPVGAFAIRPGAIMASTDEFIITVRGRGGHAAMPHTTVDPIVVSAEIIGALQMIASRTVDPTASVVVSVTQIHAGNAHNVIPGQAVFSGTTRALDSRIRDLAEDRIRTLSRTIAEAHGATAEIEYQRSYPVTFNHADQTAFAVETAREIAGFDAVDAQTAPTLGGEDFSYMLEARPGSFIFIGNGETAGLHHPAYDFNDEAIPYGMSYWVRLVERALPA